MYLCNGWRVCDAVHEYECIHIHVCVYIYIYIYIYNIVIMILLQQLLLLLLLIMIVILMIITMEIILIITMTYIYIYIWIHLSLSLYIYIYMCMYVYIYIYIYTYIYKLVCFAERPSLDVPILITNILLDLIARLACMSMDLCWRKTKVVLVKMVSRIIYYLHIRIYSCVMKLMVCVYN